MIHKAGVNRLIGELSRIGLDGILDTRTNDRRDMRDQAVVRPEGQRSHPFESLPSARIGHLISKVSYCAERATRTFVPNRPSSNRSSSRAAPG